MTYSSRSKPWLTGLSALAQAELVARGEASVEELTRHKLDYIAEHEANVGLHPFAELRPEHAIAQARALDRARRRDPDAPRGPLWGLPTALKDVHLTRGFFARAGSRAYTWAWSPLDDATSAAIRRAGFVIVGKTTTSELAILPVVEPEDGPPTRNIWDLGRTAGGSSGGAAAAVVVGFVPVAPASDGAGSIRIPAAFNGLVGLKTSHGFVPNPFKRFEPLELSVVGPIAKNADDAAALLDVLTGRVHCADNALARVRVPPPPLRIGVTTVGPLGPTDPHVVRAVERVTAALAALGHHVEPTRGLDGALDDFLPMFDFLAHNVRVPCERALEPTTRWLRTRGRHVTRGMAEAYRTRLALRVKAWFAGFDVCVTPTVPQLPPRVHATRDLAPADKLAALAQLGAFTAGFNASGQPAVTVPVWLDDVCDLPLGVQLAGRHGDDVRLLALARAVMDVLRA